MFRKQRGCVKEHDEDRSHRMLGAGGQACCHQTRHPFRIHPAQCPDPRDHLESSRLCLRPCTSAFVLFVMHFKSILGELLLNRGKTKDTRSARNSATKSSIANGTLLHVQCENSDRDLRQTSRSGHNACSKALVATKWLASLPIRFRLHQISQCNLHYVVYPWHYVVEDLTIKRIT